MKTRRFLLPALGVLVVIGVLVVAFSLVVGPFLSADRDTDFEAPGVLLLDLDGLVVERAPTDFFGAELLGADLELLDLALALDRAADDDRIAGVFARVGTAGYGWAKAEEIRARLVRFRESGKFVIAWSPLTDEKGYYVASAADRIYLLPGTMLDMNGFRVETPYVRRLLDKVGLEPQVEAIGVYKSAADMFRRDNMSDPEREVTRAILETVYERFVTAVVEARGVDRERFVQAFDDGVYLPRDLEALDLVDGERHEGEALREAIGRATDRDPGEVGIDDLDERVIDVADYARSLPDPVHPIEGTVGLVYAVGVITRGESGFDPLFGQTMGAETTVEMIRDVAGDDALDAVVIRIDSPGGDALASEEIWAAIEELKERLPVVVSMGDVAASGGYYIAAGADRIVAEPTTLTGSIGVFAVLFNARELWDKLGVTWESVQTNPAADFPTSIRPLDPEERETFRRLVEETYRTFVSRVAQGRDLSLAEVDSVARGRIWIGAQAEDVALVDRLGGLEEAMELAKEEADIDPGAAVRLHIYPREPNILEQLRQALRMRAAGETGGKRSAAAGVEEAALSLLVREIAGLVPGIGVAVREGAGRPLTVIPWVPEIR